MSIHSLKLIQFVCVDDVDKQAAKIISPLQFLLWLKSMRTNPHNDLFSPNTLCILINGLAGLEKGLLTKGETKFFRLVAC